MATGRAHASGRAAASWAVRRRALAAYPIRQGIACKLTAERIQSRQHRKHPDRELPEISNIDRAVPVEIEVHEVPALARVQAVSRREESKVGDIDVPVAVGVAKEAEEALSVAEGVIVSRRAVAVAVERLPASTDLRSDGGQRVSAVAQGTKLCFGSHEVQKRHNGPAVLDANRRSEADRAAARANQRECLFRQAAECHLAAEANGQTRHSRALR